MAKKKKKTVHKTLVEQILDKHHIAYQQIIFPTYQKDDVAQLDVSHSDYDEGHIYKTLVLTGKNTGPVVGMVPIDTHLDEKKLAKASGNKKVSMVPLKDLLKTTGYEHGANTPIGIWEKYNYPIYLDTRAEEQGQIIVSSGQIGRSVQLDATEMKDLVKGTFVDLKEE